MAKPAQVYRILVNDRPQGEAWYRHHRWWWRRRSGGTEPFLDKESMLRRILYLVKGNTIAMKKD